MSIRVKRTPPIMEIVACKLFAIEEVPKKEQTKMVNRCAIAVNKYHENELAIVKDALRDLEVVKDNYDDFDNSLANAIISLEDLIEEEI